MGHGLGRARGDVLHEHGEMFFINTVIGHLWHGIQGAHFKRMHGEDPYDHIYGLIDQHADHYHWDTGKKWSETRDSTGLTDTLGGGHAHVGMMIYQGTNFPPEYRGKVFTTNLHGHRVNIDRLDREGSGYIGKHEPDFMKTDDPWFRATEIQYGPDGGVYILDWSDIGECHEADGVHRTSGRIYKITYGDPVKPNETDMTKLSDEELVKLQLSDNEWLVRMARWELRERAWSGKDTQTTVAEIKGMLRLPNTKKSEKDLNIEERLRVLFALLHVASANPEKEFHADPWLLSSIVSTFAYESEAAQLWAWRILADGFVLTRKQKESSSKAVPDVYTAFSRPDNWISNRQLGTRLNSGTQSVRLKLASLLQTFAARKDSVLRGEEHQILATALLSHAEDATDHNLPLMYWFGIRDLPPAELVKLVNDCRIPLVTQFIARRITEEIDKDPAPLNTLLKLATTEAPSHDTESPLLTTKAPLHATEAKDRSPKGSESEDDLRADILTGMTDALKGWRKVKKPEAWDKFIASFSESRRAVPALSENTKEQAAPSTLLRDLNFLFGDGRALDEVRAIALDDKAALDNRRAALHTLIEAKSPDLRKVCESLLNVNSLGLDAIAGLATFDDPALADKIVGRYKALYPHERPQALAALASRPSFAKVLLKRVAEGKIEHNDVTPVIARQIRSFNDPALTNLLAETWGETRESSDDKKKLIASLKVKLTPEFIAKGNPSQGRAIFAGVCSVCHKLYGEGNLIGPDLTGSGRHDVGYLIENIADPSAVVVADFTMVVVTLKDGRVLNGIISAKTDRTITVKMIGMETTVDRSEITKQEQLPISMMPEGLLTAQSDEQISNLVSYLMSNNQVPMPK